MSKLTGNQEFNGDVYVKGIGGYDGTNATASTSSTLQQVLNNVGSLTEITWSNLKSLRDSSGLTPGMQYRITDYNTTTSQENTQAAGHQFDIIVTADSSNKLNENARACLHAGDTYFSMAGAKLESWELKYCLDNDTTRFAWANTGATGRGVIYRMIDEWNNECPYDFKNIQFKRKISLENGYPELDKQGGTDTWVYTFAATSYHITNNEWSGLKDGSLESPYCHESDENTSTYHDNVMEKYIILYDSEDEDYTKCGKQYLNDNVFLGYWDEVGSDDPENYPFYYAHCSYGLKFGLNCYNNTFGNNCYSNTFGNNCYSNTFGDDCNSNTFGNSCNSNTFGYDCDNNAFGDDCDSIRIQKNYVYYIVVENGNRYIDITSTQTTSLSNSLRNFTIAQGVNNSNTVKTISHNTVKDTFQTVYRPVNSQIISV